MFTSFEKLRLHCLVIPKLRLEVVRDSLSLAGSAVNMEDRWLWVLGDLVAVKEIADISKNI